MTGHLDMLDGRFLHLPEEEAFWPDPEFVGWYRDERFRE